MMLADLTLIDEMKTPDWEEDKLAEVEAETLAADAVRAAEEAKRAALRLAEVRACLRFLYADKPAAKEFIPSAEKKEESREEVPEVTEVAPLTAVEPTSARIDEPVVDESPEGEATPASPVSILKSETAEKAQPKEVRYAPEVLVSTEISAKSPADLPMEQRDILERMLDAVGLDKICGLEFIDESEKEEYEPVVEISAVNTPVPEQAATTMVTDTAEIGAHSEEAAVSAVKPDVKPRQLSPVKRRILASRRAFDSDPFDENLALNMVDSSDAFQAAVSVPRTVALSTSRPEVIVVAASSPAQKSESAAPKVTAVAAATAIVAATTAAAVTPRSEPIVEAPTSIRAPELRTVIPVDAPASEPVVVQSTPVPIQSTEDAAAPMEIPDIEQTMTPQDQSIKMTTSLSPVKQQILVKQNQPRVIGQPDPFEGEQDGMEFIPCGSGDAGCPDEVEKQNKMVSKSNSMLCGW